MLGLTLIKIYIFSTGSAYRYFRNKKEMLLATLAYYYENIQEFSGTPDSSLRSFSSPEDMLAYVLGQFYGLHRKYYALHEELETCAISTRMSGMPITGFCSRCSRYPRAEMSPRIRRTSGAQGTSI